MPWHAILERRRSHSGVASSPVAHLLKSNDSPSDEELQLIRQTISSVQQELTRAQGITSHGILRPTVNSLVCSSHIKAHEALMCPMRRFPPEILAQIFLHHKDLVPHTWQSFSWRSLPWSISQVCRRWRSVSINIPILWNQLPKIKFDNQTLRKSFISFVTMVLDRSQETLLTIHISAPAKKYHDHPLIGVMLAHSYRWESLMVKLWDNDRLIAFKDLRGRLASLSTLTLDVWDYKDNERLNMFELAPQLKSVSVAGFYPAHLALPWPQLTSYQELTHTEGADESLVSATALTSLTICREDTLPRNFSVSINTIVKLHLTIITYRSVPVLYLDHFTLPALEDLRVDHYNGGVTAGIIALLNRSQPGGSLLQKLSFRCSTFVEGELTTLLQMTPRLATLVSDLPPLSDLANMVVKLHVGPLLPNLQTLTMYVGNDGVELHQGVIRDIAESRCEPGTATPPIEFNEDTFRLPGEITPLRSFRFVFQSAAVRRRALIELNGWKSASLGSDFELIQSCIDGLMKQLKKLEKSTKMLDIFIWRKIDEMMALLEGIEDMNVKDLHATGLYFLMWDLSRRHTIGNEIRPSVRQRAATLRKRWEPLLVNHLAQQKWVFQCHRILLYLPSHDARRRSKDGSNELIKELTGVKLLPKNNSDLAMIREISMNKYTQMT